MGDARTCTEYLALISAEVAVCRCVGGIPPVEYKFSADLTDGLYLGEAVKLIEVPPFVDDDEALAAPAEDDGEELKPGL